MSTYSTSYSNYQSSYEQQRQRRREEWKQAPKKCPHCNEPINQEFDEYSNKGPRYHCGRDRCRKAASRANIAERKRQDRKDARARIYAYCEQHLDRDQKRAVMDMTDLLMAFNQDEGHQIAEKVVQVIEALRCKHDRISILIDNASTARRRAEKAEKYNEQLEQLYKERIAELEAEIHLYQLLEGAVHNIATRQLAKQPDQEAQEPQPAAAPEPPEEDDPDRAHVLATLAQAGIRPVEEALADEQEEDEEDQEGNEFDYEALDDEERPGLDDEEDPKE
jgi:hypothetical protein